MNDLLLEVTRKDGEASPGVGPTVDAVHSPAPLGSDSKKKKKKEDLSILKAGSGVMVAWFPPAELAAKLAVDKEGYETSDELHVTLAYFGKELDDDQLSDLRDSLRRITRMHAKLPGELGGVGRFPATASSDNKDVVVLLADVPYLESLRQKLLDELYEEGVEAYRNHGYSPHMTLAYINPTDESPKVEGNHIPIEVGTLTLAVGGEREEFELVGTEIAKANSCHGAHDGKFCSTGGGRGAGLKIKTAKGKAFSSEQVDVKNKPSKLEVGSLGESIVTSWLHKQGLTDARSLNVKVNNFPVDLIQDHKAYEVKAGLVSNGSSAQHWRATIGQPGKMESAWLAKATPEAKKAWNERKQNEIIKRKEAAVKRLSTKSGKKVEGGTITVIINPDTKKADIYKFKGFHSRIAWNSDQAKKGYVGTVSYE